MKIMLRHRLRRKPTLNAPVYLAPAQRLHAYDIQTLNAEYLPFAIKAKGENNHANRKQ